MKKTILTLSVLLVGYCSYAQNTFPSSGDAGIGTMTPNSYGQGGTNKVLEIYNTNTGVHSQSHVMLSTGATTNFGSIGTISWVVPNTLSNQKLAAFIGSRLESGAESAITSNLTFATNNAGAITEKMRITSSGNVGIGVINPAYGLEVAKSTLSIESGYNAGTSVLYFAHRPGFTGQHKAGILAPSAGLYGRSTAMYFAINAENDNSNITISDAKFTILEEGNVGIGTTNPDQKLSVNGTIHAKKVLIDLNGWPDYVFKTNYKLPNLSEVKAYVDQHQHLPDMPSQKEIEKTGMDVTEINKLLTKKVEELTLYLIEQQQQIKQLEVKLDKIASDK